MPGRGLRRPCRWPRALARAVAGAALLLAPAGPALAQALTPDMLQPQAGGFAPLDKSLLRKTDGTPDFAQGDSFDDTSPDAQPPASQPPVPFPTSPAASGAGDTGYDSLGRKKKTVKRAPGARTPVPVAVDTGRTNAAVDNNPTLPLALPKPPPPIASPPSATANRAPVAPALADRVNGQPYRRLIKVDPDPYGAVGFYAGGFLVKSAVELYGGYDSNPARVDGGRGSWFYKVAPEFVATSDWTRHAVSVDLRGSFTGYENGVGGSGVSGVSAAPLDLDIPDLTGKVNGRLDVTRDTRVLGEGRVRVSIDNPGSPNIQVGLQRYPIYVTPGVSLGVQQDFNRLQVTATGLFDRTMFQNSKLTDGTSSSNDDRDYNQFGATGRVAYEVLPWLKPFGEVTYDTRQRDEVFDRSGYERSSDGLSSRVGTTFELTRLLTGDISIGYASRTYADPRLKALTGLLTQGSLVWTVTPLTTAKFLATSSLDETTLSGVSGVMTRTYTFEVDHDFRRWLTGIGRFMVGTADYQGGSRSDVFYSLSGGLTYRMTREVQLKAELRHDWLDSNVTGASNHATVVMLGVRLQR